MKDQMIAAGLVLFNPDSIERTAKCIKKIADQVQDIYIYDNSTKKNTLVFPSNVTYLTEHTNRGVAYALNRIMEQAKFDGYEWVLTMDQDSLLPDGMVNDFQKYIDCEEKIGVICPQVIDKRRAYMNINPCGEKIEYLQMCITSASCTSIKAWECVGKFDEWLFIDLVDNEFCKRLVASGYKILQIKKWILDQEFGNIIPKSKKKQDFWIKVSHIMHNRNLAKLSYKKNVSPTRVFYTCRNIIYVNRKMKNYGSTAYENYNCKGYAGFIICFIFPSFLRSKQKIKVVKAIITGTWSGYRKKISPWTVS